jgi:DHA3 family multidrug efflux protein-like MFS transporter
MDTNKKTFYHLLANSLVAVVTNAFVWFALTFWVFLTTRSVLATSYIAGTFAIANMFSAIFFGHIVDKNKKKNAMALSSAVSLVAYIAGAALYFMAPEGAFLHSQSVYLWILIVILMIGSVAGNLRYIALSTTVTLLFKEGRDKANGMVGAINGISFTLTSVLSGLAIGFLGMGHALVGAIIATVIALVHMLTIHIDEPVLVHVEGHEHQGKFDFKKTIGVIALVPGLFALIFFTTFNNFLGGVFMALMDAYGLSLVSVQTWGIMFAFLSLGFIFGSSYIAKRGLGSKPLKKLLTINIITWTTCIFFTIQPSVVLLAVGMLIWMTLSPFVEATEQTMIQAVVPYERQGRVFGFAQSVESAATPITAFLIGPIAQFIFIPFMTTGGGVSLIGDWFGTGPARGIALVFSIAGTIGLIVTLIAFRSKSYKVLSEKYAESKAAVSAAPAA